jgi:MFS transporter, CP family, cyanate transporter
LNPPPTRRRFDAGRWVPLFAASLVLRPPLAAVGPLVPRLQRDLDISHAVAGLAPAALLLAMGVSSLVAPAVVRRSGWLAATTVALALIGVAGLARAIVPSAAALILLSVPIGVGSGIGGTSLPSAVADLYREHRAAGTAIHALGINVGATGAAALAVPLAILLGGWRESFAFFALAGLALSALWIFGVGEHPQTRPPSLALPLRDRRAWTLTTLFALQGLCYYGFGAWLSDAYVERGWSQGAGGGLVAVVTASAVPASFVVPRVVARRLRSRVPALAACTAVLFTGALLLAAAPALAWFAAVLVGAALGGIFSLCLLLAVELGRATNEVAGFAGMMFGFGYTVSAAAPFVLGVVRDAAGSFGTALWLIVGISSSILVLLAARRRLLEPTPEPVPPRIA